jgi:hypothetical protein
MNANYLNAFNTLLTGTNDTARAGAEGGRAFADVNFNLNNNYQNAMDSATKLGESYGLTGTRRVGDLLGVAAGYDDSAAGYGALGNQWLNTLAQNRSERESLMNAIPGYWDNTLAPMGFTQMTLQQGLDEYLNHEKDTVVSKSGGLCFITTAACDYLGKPDDCYELTTFRDFRDMWLRFQPGGEAMVRMYYKEAPRIVGRLNDSPEKDAVYRKLWSEYLTPCVAFIKAREYERCRDMYLTMVFMLMEMFPDESEAA